MSGHHWDRRPPAGFGIPGLWPVLAVVLPLAACLADDPAGLAPSAPAATTVKLDFEHRPLPEIPLPNDIATRYDPTSPTGRRVNASMVAPTSFEVALRASFDRLDGWGVFQPITIPFTGPLDVQSILDGHRDVDYDPSNDVVYLVDIDPDSPDRGASIPLDLGEGNYPVVLEDIGRYWPNDPRGGTLSLYFEETNEDVNGNGVLDPGEDANRNGAPDPGEDKDDDGVLDPPEDTDADGVFDRPNYLPGMTPAWDDLAGRADALMTFYEAETHTLIARPLLPLRERTTYAVVVTRRLRDAHGLPVGSPYPYINHAAQTEALRSLPELLPAGLTLGDIAFAFSFTTESVTSAFVAARDGLYGHGPQAHLAAEFPAEIDELMPLREGDEDNVYILYNEDWTQLLSVLAPAVFGIDSDSEEFRAILESQRYVDYHVMGSFLSPQLFPREGANGETLPLTEQVWPEDLDRVAAPARAERVYFWLTVPRREVSARGQGQPVPLAILSHGYGSARFESLVFNGHFARHGTAVLSIDCVGHGLVVPDGDLQTIERLVDLFGVEQLFAAMLRSRAIDLNADGTADSGGDFWTAYLFHTRDLLRQSVLDHMQLVRILRTFDGQHRWDFDLDGDGQNELAGDFDGDGAIDIGGDAVLSAIGGSLGGIMSTLLGELEPAVDVIVPISGGGGLSDAGLRSLQGGVVEAVVLRLMGPLYVGHLEAGQLVLRTIVPDVNDDESREVARVDGVLAGDSIVLENLDSGEVRCAYVSPEGTMRVSVASDLGDPHRLTIYRGPALETGSPCRPVVGAEVVATLDAFGTEVSFQNQVYAAGSPLVAIAEGLGLRRANPELRRMLSLSQMVLDPADPVAFARQLGPEPLVYPGTQERTGAHAIIVTTVGDMAVPASLGVTLGRAAGFIDYRNDDARYGVPANEELIETYMAEAVHSLRRFTHGTTGEGVHIDVENFSEGTDIWGADIPRLDPPLRLLTDAYPDGQSRGGISGALFPYPVPEGMHGFPFPGQLTDRAIAQCEAACTEEACDCDDVETFDVGFFLFNIFGSYVTSGGQEIDFDLCHAHNDCVGTPPPPDPR